MKGGERGGGWGARGGWARGVGGGERSMGGSHEGEGCAGRQDKEKKDGEEKDQASVYGMSVYSRVWGVLGKEEVGRGRIRSCFFYSSSRP